MSSNYRPQERYREKQLTERGMIRLAVWIPAEARDRVLKFVKSVRQQAKKR